VRDPALNPARNPGESFEAFKLRQKGVRGAVKTHLNGKDSREVQLFFESHPDGSLTITGTLQVGNSVRQKSIQLSKNDNHAQAITLAKKAVRKGLLEKRIRAH
jgi:uncharacterized HAD superfamily protein